MECIKKKGINIGIVLFLLFSLAGCGMAEKEQLVSYSYETEEETFRIEIPENWECETVEKFVGDETFEGLPDYGLKIYVNGDKEEEIYLFRQVGHIAMPSYGGESMQITPKLSGTLYMEGDGDYVTGELIFEDEFYGISFHLTKDCFEHDKEQIQKVVESIQIEKAAESIQTEKETESNQGEETAENILTDLKGKKVLETEQWYAETIARLPEGTVYTFAEVGMEFPVMLAAERTFAMDENGAEQFCMDCEVYYYDGEDTHFVDKLSSLGTAYPIAYDETGFYEGGPRGARRMIIEKDGTFFRLKASEAVYVTYGENGEAAYVREVNGERRKSAEAEFRHFFQNYENATEVDFGKKSGYIISAKEMELLLLLEQAGGQKMESYLYTDMNHDGEKEMVGTTATTDYIYETWYISGDGSICEKVETALQWMDACQLLEMDLGTETHVVINVYNMMGTNKQYSILALHDGKPDLLVSNQYGYVQMAGNGDILLDVEAYDATYEKEDGFWLGHTWKDTYLYYEDGVYKEYGAAVLTEEQFMQYDNAEEVLEDIKKQNESGNLVFSYFLRENGILHIQCEREDECTIYYFYYTMRIDGNRLLGGTNNYLDGVMLPFFSSLDVTYPEVGN